MTAKEHKKDIDAWIKDIARQHVDHLHVEMVIIKELRDKLAACMEVIDNILSQDICEE